MEESGIRWISSKELMGRWKVDEIRLSQIIGLKHLPAYIIDERTDECMPADEFAAMFEPPILSDKSLVSDMLFEIKDVENFEKENPEFKKRGEDLSGKEQRELGQLRREKEKWDRSIEAAVMVGMFCPERKNVLIKDELVKYLIEIGAGDLPDTTMDRIWGAIPQKYRKTAGRPRKPNTNDPDELEDIKIPKTDIEYYEAAKKLKRTGEVGSLKEGAKEMAADEGDSEQAVYDKIMRGKEEYGEKKLGESS